MNIFIATYGSRGDVQPYLALGRGLLNAGHNVTIATSVRFQADVQAIGLHYGYMNDELLSILDTQLGRSLIDSSHGLIGNLKQLIQAKKKISPLQTKQIEECWLAAKDANPDVIIFHPKAFGAPSYAEKLGVPVMLASVVPMLVPSSTTPHIGFPSLKLGKWYNRLTYSLVNLIMQLSISKPIRHWRVENGLPAKGGINLLRTHSGSSMPVLQGFSRHVADLPLDNQSQVTTTGYWFTETPDWQPSQALSEFLESGPPPVYIGFGSMVGQDPQQLTETVIAALTKAKVRGILASGWGGIKSSSLPDSIIEIDHAPHQWLFPKMAAIVHHCGAGTTAAALRAGKPSIPVPFFGDQPYWAKRLYELGVSSIPLPKKSLNSDSLAQEIKHVISDVSIQKNAEILGQKVRREGGIEKAVKVIEHYALNE